LKSWTSKAHRWSIEARTISRDTRRDESSMESLSIPFEEEEGEGNQALPQRERRIN
jgi:hypothetical protein